MNSFKFKIKCKIFISYDKIRVNLTKITYEICYTYVEIKLKLLTSTNDF